MSGDLVERVARAMADEEQFRPMYGYEWKYEVSDLGRIRSIPRIAQRRHLPMTVSGRILSTRVGLDGRERVSLSVNNHSYSHLVHVLVLETFVGPRPAGMEACHNNGICTDNRLSNLRWDTHAANEADSHSTAPTCVAKEVRPQNSKINRSMKFAPLMGRSRTLK